MNLRAALMLVLSMKFINVIYALAAQGVAVLLFAPATYLKSSALPTGYGDAGR